MAIPDFLKKKASGSVAKNRLQLVLVSDRAGCSPEVMEQIKNDIIAVITKYVDIDTEGLDIQIKQTPVEGGTGTVPMILANIPIREIKTK